MKRQKFAGIDLEPLLEERIGRVAVRRVLEIDTKSEKEKSALLASLKTERRRIVTEITRLQRRLLRIGDRMADGGSEEVKMRSVQGSELNDPLGNATRLSPIQHGALC